jgi:hypothetical protein
MMNVHVHLRLSLVALILLVAPPLVSAQTAAAPTQHDGQHDFDFVIGSWKVHLKKLVKPLTGSTTWIEYDGTSMGRKVWDGKANIDEFHVEDPQAHTRVDGMTLRLYNPETHQWSLYWANAKNAVLAMPPTVGHFENGRGEFYDEEEWEGRKIVVRYVWSDITATSAKFEQAFSVDGGKTWEPNWIATQTRVK